MKNFIIIALLITTTLSNSLSAHAQNTEDYSSEELMAMDFEDLMNLTITIASKKSESSFDSPLSSTVITSDEIRNSGATSIPEIFRLVPGFIVREETNGVFDIHIRGNDNIPSGELMFSSENTLSLVMIDNRKVYNYINGGVAWESLPVSINDIDRIEIIRGAATAMYGPNAVSGVVNIITKEAVKKSISVNANAEAGTQNTQMYNFSIGSSQLDNKLNLQVSGNYETRDRFENDYYCYALGKKVSNSNVVNAFSQTIDPSYANDVLNTGLAKEQKGINVFTNYDFNDKSNISLDFGYQYSLAQNISMESLSSPITTRESESNYINYQGNFNRLTTQAALHTGTYDLFVGGPTSSQFDFTILEGSAEYNLEYNKLTLRPGINIQNAAYNDLPYITDTQKGYVNGDNTIFNFGYFVRSEYNISQKLRFIAALRMDHYNHPDDAYFTYQFISTYAVNDKNIFRANVSRANRGPFINDLYSNYSQTFPTGQTLKLNGNENINLPVSDLFEIGYRSKLLKNLTLDMELFYSVTKNFTGHLFVDSYSVPVIESTFNSTGIKAKQTGVSGIVNWMPTTKYSLKMFGTYQYTNKTVMGSSETVKHKNTPDFYGGAIFTANPFENLTFNTSLYYTSSQTFEHLLGTAKVDANTLVNAKISYKVVSKAAVFVNGKNLLNTNKEQFGFGDVCKTMLLGGVELTF